MEFIPTRWDYLQQGNGFGYDAFHRAHPCPGFADFALMFDDLDFCIKMPRAAATERSHTEDAMPEGGKMRGK